MHSLKGCWKWMVLGSLAGSLHGAAISEPVITPAPGPGVEIWIKRQDPDAVSFAQVLLTAIPLSLRRIAATNVPAVSTILWQEFLDDKRPQWFLDLPWDIQSYLIKEFGPKTAWYTASPRTTGAQTTPATSNWQWPTSSSPWRSSQATPSASRPTSAVRSSTTLASDLSFGTVPSTRSSQPSNSTSTISIATSRSISTNPASSVSATPSPASPPASGDGLTRGQKFGLGLGIPFGLFGAAALLFGCCFLLRRRKHQQMNGSEPPSSPGFIPRFAFQDKSTDHLEHRRPLNPAPNLGSQGFRDVNWEDDGYDPYETAAFASAPMSVSHKANTFPPTAAAMAVATAAPPVAPMAMHDPQPIMAPALYHTHSSNRARGRRTSYNSLHSVTELSEPDEEPESPVLGRQTTPSQKTRKSSLPMVLEIPSTPQAATIKRKPVPESPTGISPAAAAASESLLRPPIRPVDNSGSSSSGLAISTDSSNGAGYQTDATSPVSPISQHAATTNPFSTDYSYVEDYGPEFHSGYLDHEDGLYGGNRSLDRYPDPSPPRRSSKTEWPLRNLSMGHRRNKSPMWDRMYER